MRSLFRFSIALLGVCCAYSSSQAFWWHHKDRGNQAPAASCVTAACAPAVTYMAQTQNVVTTRTVMVPVQQQVVTQRTVLVPVQLAPVAAPTGCTGAPMAAPAGCTGTPVAAPAGCFGTPTGAGCFGTAPGTGCMGGKSGTTYIGNAGMGSFDDALPPKLARLETRIYNIENKIDALTESVNEMRDAKSSLPALPTIPPLPGSATKPTPLGSAAPTETDSVLAAARAYKAKQAATPTTAATPLVPAGADAGVTRK